MNTTQISVARAAEDMAEKCEGFMQPLAGISLHSACVIAFSAVLLSGGCERHPAPPAPPPTTVTVARPVQHAVVEWDEYTGYLSATDAVDVHARVSGLIVAAPFQEGIIVKEGTVLFEIDPRPFQADLDSKLADIAKGEAQVVLNQIQFDKTTDLLKHNASTQFEVDTAQANLKQAIAAVAGAKAAAETARLNLEWCRVTAPIAGRISRKYVTPGNLITGGDGQGSLLTTIRTIDPIYCYINVDERSVLKYQQLLRAEHERTKAAIPSLRASHIPCYLQLANEAGFPHEGELDFSDNRVDPNTGTMQVRGIFPNPGGWLAPGFFARVRVQSSASYPALLVPDAAVGTNQDQRFLLMVKPDDTVEQRSVQLGALFGELRAIATGVGLTDRVVINGQAQARPGAKVALKEIVISAAALPPLPPAATQPEPTTATGTTP